MLKYLTQNCEKYYDEYGFMNRDNDSQNARYLQWNQCCNRITPIDFQPTSISDYVYKNENISVFYKNKQTIKDYYIYRLFDFNYEYVQISGETQNNIIIGFLNKNKQVSAISFQMTDSYYGWELNIYGSNDNKTWFILDEINIGLNETLSKNSYFYFDNKSNIGINLNNNRTVVFCNVNNQSLYSYYKLTFKYIGIQTSPTMKIGKMSFYDNTVNIYPCYHFPFLTNFKQFHDLVEIKENSNCTFSQQENCLLLDNGNCLIDSSFLYNFTNMSLTFCAKFNGDNINSNILSKSKDIFNLSIIMSEQNCVFNIKTRNYNFDVLCNSEYIKNKWHHYAFISSEKYDLFLIDGKQKMRFVKTNDIFYNEKINDFIIGKNNSSSTNEQFLSMYIKYFSIYNFPIGFLQISKQMDSYLFKNQQ